MSFERLLRRGLCAVGVSSDMTALRCERVLVLALCAVLSTAVAAAIV
jgi:hypothetical protein